MSGVILLVDRVLGNVNLKDDAKGRRAYEAYMEERVAELRQRAARKRVSEEWKSIRYGWYVGDDGFREDLFKKLAEAVKGKDQASYHGMAIHLHDEQEAERLVRSGMRLLKVTEGELARLPKGNEEKCALAWLAHTQSLASHG